MNTAGHLLPSASYPQNIHYLIYYNLKKHQPICSIL